MVTLHLVFTLLVLYVETESAFEFSGKFISIPLHRVSRKHNDLHNVEEFKNAFTIPVSGNISTDGEFFVELFFGDPPQSLWVQVDTGSADLLVYSSNCFGCNQSSPSFKNSQSKTAHEMVCNNSICNSCTTLHGESVCSFNELYGDGSDVEGYFINDHLTLGGDEVIVDFGLITNASVNFEEPPVSGIWGLAYKAIASIEYSTIDAIFSQMGIYRAFSMCLLSDEQQSVMTFGTDYRNDTDFQWTPIVQETYYVVEMLDLQVNGESIGVSQDVFNNPRCIVDSGTTALLLPNEAFMAVQRIFEGLCSRIFLPGVCNAATGYSLFNGYCYPMTANEKSNFPLLGISLKGLSSELIRTPNDYLISVGENIECLGIASSGIGNEVVSTVLGDVFMQGFHVVFDQEISAIGFANVSSCPSISRSSASTSSSPIIYSCSAMARVSAEIILSLSILVVFTISS